MKYSHPYLILGRKSRLKVELHPEDIFIMTSYHHNLTQTFQRMRKGLNRTRLEKEAERIKTWIEVNKITKAA